MLAEGQLNLTIDATLSASSAALDRLSRAGMPPVDLSVDLSIGHARHRALLPQTANRFQASQLAAEVAAQPGVRGVTLAAARRPGRGDADTLVEWRELGRWGSAPTDIRAA